jgi:hypothetical protein
MRPELDPARVGERLAALAALYVPESVEEGRARLRRDAMSPDVFAASVARRLDELRALDDLTHYLHGVARPPSSTSR